MREITFVAIVVVLVLGSGYLYDDSSARECAARGGHLVKTVQGIDKAVCAKLELLPAP